MRCSRCGAPTLVTDSRSIATPYVTKRTRVCSGSKPHRLTTYEVSSSVWGTCKARANAVAKSAPVRWSISEALEKRNAEIIAALADGRRAVDLAAEYGLSKQSISMIKAANVAATKALEPASPDTMFSGLVQRKSKNTHAVLFS